MSGVVKAADRPMRVAVANWCFRRMGGTETYLAAVIPALLSAGLELAAVCENDGPAGRAPIPLPPAVPVFESARLGVAATLDALRAWGPDVIYTHILEDPELESGLVDVAPSVFDAHAYYGTCISGLKAFRTPVAQPCHRTFGAPCLAYYLPRGCGGRSPVTMVRRYRREVARSALLPRYGALVVHSEHMREEYARHGVARDRIHNMSLSMFEEAAQDRIGGRAPIRGDEVPSAATPLHLVFSTRMDRLKGGDMLLAALPRVHAALQRPVRVTFAGDGPARGKWERKAAALTRRLPDITVDFAGWLPTSQVSALYATGDLLVVPSVWPEPFGRVGVEAGQFGLPTAAFAVGGIPDWLADGVNGHLAPGDPPTAAGLADAIVACVRDPEHHAALRAGARARAVGVIATDAAAQLRRIFEEAVANAGDSLAEAG